MRPNQASAIEESASVAAPKSGNAAALPCPLLIDIARSKSLRAVCKSPIPKTVLPTGAVTIAVARAHQSLPQTRVLDLLPGDRHADRLEADVAVLCAEHIHFDEPILPCCTDIHHRRTDLFDQNLEAVPLALGQRGPRGSDGDHRSRSRRGRDRGINGAT